MSIKIRIYLAVLLPLAGVILLGALGGWSMNTLGNENKQLVNEKFLPLINVDLKNLLEKQEEAIQLILEADRDAHQALIAEKLCLTADEDEMKALIESHDENIAQVEERVGKAIALVSDKEVDAIQEKFQKKFSEWKEKSKKVVSYSQIPAKLKFGRNISAGSAQTLFGEMRDILDGLTEIQQTRIKDTLAHVNTMTANTEKEAKLTEERASKAFTAFIAISTAVIIISLIISTVIIRRIISPINQGVRFAKTVAEGDLSVRMNMEGDDELAQLCNSLDIMVDNIKEKADIAERIAAGDITEEVTLSSEKDGLGRSLNSMINNLNKLLEQIHTSSDSVATGTGQVAAASQSLSQGATEQAASLEEISSSMTEVGSQSASNSERTQELNKLTKGVETVSSDGNKKMKEMILAMTEINDSSKQIEKIIKVIDDIAFQTNLLALNAAVEAARAGSQGKGFAVVAEEVRSLASRSAKAAHESAGLIESAIAKVGTGVEIAHTTASSLEEVVEQVASVSGLIEEISSSSKEQSVAVSQIMEALSQIDKVTQQNAANSEETASVSSELSSQTQDLQELVGQFRLKSQGNDSQSFKAERAPQLKPAMGSVSEKDSAVSWGSSNDVNSNESLISLDNDFGKY